MAGFFDAPTSIPGSDVFDRVQLQDLLSKIAQHGSNLLDGITVTQPDAEQAAQAVKPLQTTEVPSQPLPGVPYSAPEQPAPNPSQITTGSVAPRPATPDMPDRSLAQKLSDFGNILAGGKAPDREAQNLTYKTLIGKGVDENTALAAVRNPAIFQQLAPVVFGAKGASDFGVIGEDQFGNKKYGFIDKRTRTIEPAPSQGQAPASASNLQGDQFLATLDKPTADMVRALADGRMQFPTGRGLNSPYFKQLLQMVSQYDPNFDAVNYNARSKTRNDFTSGKSAQNLTSFNTVIGHLDALDKAIDGLGNWDTLPSANKVLNPIAGAVSGDFQARQKNFEIAKQAVIDELTRAFRGTGGNVHDLVEWEKSINSTDSPKALHAAVQQAVELLRSRIEAVGDQYNKGMGTTRNPVELLTPKAQEAIKRLGGVKDAPAPASDQASPIDQARAAIAKGADRNAVIQRLKQNGIDPGGL